MLKKLISVAGAIIALGLFAEPAAASTLQLTYNGGDGAEFTGEINSNPIPLSYYTGAATEIALSDYSGNVGSNDLDFFNSSSNGGFAVDNGGVFDTGGIGDQIYSGSEATPSFMANVYEIIPIAEFPNTGGTLTITAVSSAPEPASWALMIAGVGMVGLAFRAAKRRQGFATAA